MSTLADSSAATPGVYHLEEDVPGRRLVLAWQGPAPHRLARGVGAAAVLLILAATAAFARFEFVPVIQRLAAQPGGDAVGMAVLGGMLIVGGLVMTFYAARGAGARDVIQDLNPHCRARAGRS